MKSEIKKNLSSNSIEITDKNLGDAVRLLINSKFNNHEEAILLLGTKNVQVFRNYLSQLSNDKGNLSKLKEWLEKLDYEVTFTLKPKAGEEEEFSKIKFNEYIQQKKFTSALKMLYRKGSVLDPDEKLELEMKLEAAKTKDPEVIVVPVHLSLEALERVMNYNDPHTISGRINKLILREHISDNDFSIIRKALTGKDPVQIEVISKMRKWLDTGMAEVTGNRLEYTVEETVIIGKRIFVLLHKDDDKMIEVTSLFTTTFLKEVCKLKNKENLKVIYLTRNEEYNLKITARYDGKDYEASVLGSDEKPKKITFQK